jgi:hypothetical protein
MDATKPYEFIRFGAVDVTKPYEFIGFGAGCGRKHDANGATSGPKLAGPPLRPGEFGAGCWSVRPKPTQNRLWKPGQGTGSTIEQCKKFISYLRLD